MMRLKTKFVRSGMLRIAALATAGIALSGCTYDLGLGYASDGYGSGYYDCDPYSPFDNYYNCDNGYGFSNIGYGGGWYDNYWYPGHGFFLFDNYGRRFNMRDNHRRYWGERRHRWYRENGGRHEGGGRYDGRGRGYTGNNGADTIGSPDRSRGDGRRDRNRGWRGGERNGANATPLPTPDAARGDRAGRGRGEGRRGDGSGYRQPPANTGNAAQPAASRPAATPRSDAPRVAPAERRGRESPDTRPD